MIDTHKGRANPPFVPKSDPEKYISLINNHGVLSRVMQARKCPCVQPNGSPSMYCTLCNGDGMVYGFQRKLLQPDEDTGDRDWVSRYDDPRMEIKIYPFRIPILQPVKAERMLPPEQGGITEYDIVAFDSTSITIRKKDVNDELPLHYQKMRVTYYFDRYDYVQDEIVSVDAANNILTTKKTRYDDGHRTGNVQNVHGDITIVERVYNTVTLHEYTSYTFRKNNIYVTLNPGDPPLVDGEIAVTYYYCPPTKTLPADPMTRMEMEKYDTDMRSGNVRIAFEPWYEVGQGDLITFLTMVLYKQEVLVHNNNIDKLMEFDVANIDDEILDEDGVKYRKDVDFILTNFRDIRWVGAQPAPGKKISVRYGYYPTYVVFQDDPIANSLENKIFPYIVTAKLWQKTLHRDIRQIQNPEY